MIPRIAPHARPALSVASLTTRTRALTLALLILASTFATHLAPSPAFAHPLAPALLQLEEREDGLVDVLWKRSSLAVPGSNIEPITPAACPATNLSLIHI